MDMRKTTLLAVSLLAACGDDPVNYSAPVGIELKTKSGEVMNSAVNAEKGITTESGNPYGKFVDDARARLGRDPGSIELESVTMTLGAQSTNVASLADVLTGESAVTFLVNDTNNTHVAGHFTNPTGVGPVGGHVAFDWATVGDQDVAKMLGGGFKVGLTGPAAAGWESKGAEASLQLTFTFTAFE